MDSLRYWVLEMHVDGFRFDLASALARELFEVDRLAAFFDIIHQDPVLSQVKLIAEPWDLGQGGYQVGNFPGAVDGMERQVPRLGAALLARRRRHACPSWRRGSSGSNDLYAHSGRQPYASINFITAHDGFTLHDLVSYNEKHNEANGEENRDGENNNLSWNCGVEGPTDDPAIDALRERQKRNFLATLLLSQGVPMISHGDELGRTQLGNNNAYCQDNEHHLDRLGPRRRQAKRSSSSRAKLVHFRLSQPDAAAAQVFPGPQHPRRRVKDVAWLAPDGREMTDEAWNAGFVRSLGMLLSGTRDRGGRRARRADHRRHAARAAERPRREGAVHAAAARRRTSSGSASSTHSTRTDVGHAQFKAGGGYPAAGPLGRRASSSRRRCASGAGVSDDRRRRPRSDAATGGGLTVAVDSRESVVGRPESPVGQSTGVWAIDDRQIRRRSTAAPDTD